MNNYCSVLEQVIDFHILFLFNYIKYFKCKALDIVWTEMGSNGVMFGNGRIFHSHATFKWVHWSILNFLHCCCSYFVFSVGNSIYWSIDYHSQTRTHLCNTPWHSPDSDLQIYAVTPIPDSQDVLQRDGVPDNIKSFYKVNNIWRFRYDRPFHKGTKDKENEFKVGWHCKV